MVARLARILRPGGELRFVTDIADYAAWTLQRLLRSPDFAWTAERADDWRKAWPDFTAHALPRQGRARTAAVVLPDFPSGLKSLRITAAIGLPHLPEAHHALRGRGRKPSVIGEGGIEPWPGRAVRVGRNMMTAFTVGQLKIGGLAQDQHRIGPVAVHQPVGDLRSAPWPASPARPPSLRICVRRRTPTSAASFSRLACVKAEHDALRGAIIARTDARADFLGDLGEHVAESPPCTSGVAAASRRSMHDRGRFGQQLAKHRRRNVRPQTRPSRPECRPLRRA